MFLGKLGNTNSKGYHHTGETRTKMSLTHKLVWSNPEYKHNQLKAINTQSRKRTDIELWLENTVKSLGYEYTTQKPYKFTVIDVFIEPNIALYADGCYWHSCPIHCPNSLPKRHMQDADKRTTMILEDQGFKVVRFWEHEIKENPEQVKAKITELLSYKA